MIECEVIGCVKNSVSTGEYKEGDTPQCMADIIEITTHGICETMDKEE